MMEGDKRKGEAHRSNVNLVKSSQVKMLQMIDLSACMYACFRLHSEDARCRCIKNVHFK